ncbi:MAG: tetratricopeptide repeat protein [Planctomycetes bacterium]|nr:tetratricopeptide repeat protein [Planctomycetota bacterium]
MSTERIDKLLKLLEADPDDTFCLYALAQEYAKAGELERAVGQYEALLKVDPDYLYGYYHLACACETLGRMDDALSIARQGLERAQAAGNDEKARSELAELVERFESA